MNNLSGFRYNVDKISDKTISYADITHNSSGEYLVIPYTEYSDYHGSIVERANCKAFLELFGELDGVYELSGWYGASGVIIKYELYETNREIKEIIDNLFNYPCINDETLSVIEWTIENEAWDGWIKDDLIRALDKLGKEYPEDDCRLKIKFYSIANNISEYVIFETANSCYIDVDKIADNWG